MFPLSVPRTTRGLSVFALDSFPDLSVSIRRYARSPLGVLTFGFLVAVLCGLALHPRVFALAGGLGLVIVVGVCWPWLTLRGTSASLRFDRERACEGEAVPVAVEISNHLPWPSWGMLVRGGFQGGAEGAVRLEAAPSRSRSTCRWTFVPSIRGRYPSSAPRLSTRFPFGIWHAQRTVLTDRNLIVWPKTFPVGALPIEDGANVIEGNVARNKVGSTGDVLGVRPYRRGDSPRRIHWAQSAKHDRFIVCELATHTRPVVMLLLDTDPAVHTPGGDGSREWSIRVTASFAKGWVEAGAQVGLAAGETVLMPASGPGQLTRIMDRLAGITDGDAVTLPVLLRHPKLASAPSAILIAVTTDVGMDLAPRDGAVRLVALRLAGFGGSGVTTSHGPPPWLDIPNPEQLPQRLRLGWAEARHGS
jgi:uncharacterized protein (DUF58 family)